MRGILLVLLLVPDFGRAECVHQLNFLNESTRLTENSRAILQDVVQRYGRSKVSILGNADMVANAGGNSALAAARAAMVRQLMLDAGVPERRIEMGRAGEDVLAARGVGRIASRRVVLLQVEDCTPGVAPRRRGGPTVITTTTTTTTVIP